MCRTGGTINNVKFSQWELEFTSQSIDFCFQSSFFKRSEFVEQWLDKCWEDEDKEQLETKHECKNIHCKVISSPHDNLQESSQNRHTNQNDQEQRLDDIKEKGGITLFVETMTSFDYKSREESWWDVQDAVCDCQTHCKDDRLQNLVRLKYL